MSAASDLFDAEIRHSVGIRRFSNSEVKDVLHILEKSDRELRILLNDSLKQGMTLKSRRFRSMLADIRSLRNEAWKSIRVKNSQSMIDLAIAEQDFSKAIFQKTIPVQLEYAAASVQQLTGLIKDRPFSGGANAARTLDQWWDGLSGADGRRITESIQLGIVQGETVGQMVKRVRVGNNLTRANAEAITRTAVNHTTNMGREAFFNENADVVKALRWSGVLDGRTSDICRARDGHYAPLQGKPVDDTIPHPRLNPPTARPPAHPSCRTQMTSVLNLEGIEELMGERPFVRDTRTRKFRERDFRKEAKGKAGNRWKKMTSKQRTTSVRKIRKRWVKENVGTVPSKINHDKWLRKQPSSFQNEVLGIQKGDFFRRGLRLDQFVDAKGASLNLAQLRRAHPALINPPSVKTPPKWTQSAQNKWEDSLSLAEKEALEDWTSGSYKDIRKFQHGKLGFPKGQQIRVEAMFRKQIEVLETALDRAPVFTEGPIYRGISVTSAEFAKLQRAKVISDSAFTSFSRSREVATGFAAQESRGVEVVFKVLKNKTGVSIEKVSSMSSELEVLLSPGVRYEIVEWRRVTLVNEFGDKLDGWEVILREF